MADPPAGCARTTGAVVGDKPATAPSTESPQPQKEAPAYERPRRTEGTRISRRPPTTKASFTNVKLSDYLGKWVLLCFYPGDFTFV